MIEPTPNDNPLEYTARLVRKVNRLERALTVLVMEPGSPHHASEEAYRILTDQE